MKTPTRMYQFGFRLFMSIHQMNHIAKPPPAVLGWTQYVRFPVLIAAVALGLILLSIAPLTAVEFQTRESSVDGTVTDGSPTVLINVKGKDTLPGCEREYLTKVTYPAGATPGATGTFTQPVRYFPGENTIVATSATAEQTRTTMFTIAKPQLLVKLEWAGKDLDYDLYVNDINWKNDKTTVGELDRDAYREKNNDGTGGTGPGIEKVTIPSAIAGTYKIYVNYFDDHGNGKSSPTTVTVTLGSEVIFKQQKTISKFENKGESLAGTGESVWNVGTVVIHADTKDADDVGGYRVVDENWTEKLIGMRDMFMGPGNKPMVMNGTAMGIFPQTDYNVTGIAGPKGTGIVVIGKGQSAQFYANGTVNSKGMVQNCAILGKLQSSDESVGKIDALGVLTGLKGGKTKVTVLGGVGAIDVYVVDPDIDADVNRNGVVDNESDEEAENVPVQYLSKRGALVLVNADKDDAGITPRDFEDEIVNGPSDLDDLSPISIGMKGDVPDGYELWLRLKPSSDIALQPTSVFIVNGTQSKSILGPAAMGKTEVRIDQLQASGLTLFPAGKENRYDNVFYVEGRHFSLGFELVLELRLGSDVIAKDVVSMSTCPWIANHNSSPLSPDAKFQMYCSQSFGYTWDSPHGVTKFAKVEGFYVQDDYEWGFQYLPLQGDKGKFMTVGIRLASQNSGSFSETVLSNKFGIYGDSDGGDEIICDLSDSANQAGGNLECLPPIKGFPYGLLIVSDGIASPLKSWLLRQKVQINQDILTLPVNELGLGHIDEVICILGSKVIMLDWLAGVTLCSTGDQSTSLPASVLISETPLPKYATTFGQLTSELNKPGSFLNLISNKKELIYKQMRKKISDLGFQVIALPGLSLRCVAPPAKDGDGILRGIPSNAINSQVINSTKIVAYHQLEPGGKASRFFLKWQEICLASGITMEEEKGLRQAWVGGGEAHCVSGSIRSAYKP